MNSLDPFAQLRRPLGGIDVVVSPDQPKMQLGAAVCEVLNPAFIAEMNAWMRDFFGTTNLIPDGETVIVGGRQMFMNPRTYARLKVYVER